MLWMLSHHKMVMWIVHTLVQINILLVRTITKEIWQFKVFNRPGVAGAVLQTPLWLINWLTHSSLSKYLQNTFTPKPWELGPHLSCVIFHVSCVTCHISYAMYHKKIKINADKAVEFVVGGSVINGAIPSSLKLNCLKIWFQEEKSWFSTLECQFSFCFHWSPSSSSLQLCLLETQVHAEATPSPELWNVVGLLV